MELIKQYVIPAGKTNGNWSEIPKNIKPEPGYQGQVRWIDEVSGSWPCSAMPDPQCGEQNNEALSADQLPRGRLRARKRVTIEVRINTQALSGQVEDFFHHFLSRIAMTQALIALVIQSPGASSVV